MKFNVNIQTDAWQTDINLVFFTITYCISYQGKLANERAIIVMYIINPFAKIWIMHLSLGRGFFLTYVVWLFFQAFNLQYVWIGKP